MKNGLKRKRGKKCENQNWLNVLKNRFKEMNKRLIIKRKNGNENLWIGIE